MNGLWKLVVAVVLAAGPAWAEGLVYAVHPLNVVEAKDDADTKRLQALFAAQLERLGLAQVPTECIAEFLAKLPNRTCEADEGCLADLGRQCKAERVLWVNAVPNSSPSTLRLSGKVVRTDGLAGSNALDAEVSKGNNKKSKDNLVGEALHGFLVKLTGMGFTPPSLPAVVETTTGEAPQSTPARPLPPPAAVRLDATSPPQPSAGKGWKTAGYIAMGTGLAALVTSMAISMSSHDEQNRLKSLLDSSGRRPDTQEARQLVDSLNRKSTWATVTVVSGSALIVAGGAAVLWGRHRDRAVRVSAAPSVGGGMLVMGGDI